jgi:hypothetical protein
MIACRQPSHLQEAVNLCFYRSSHFSIGFNQSAIRTPNLGCPTIGRLF